jgi:hypothetical protein
MTANPSTAGLPARLAKRAVCDLIRTKKEKEREEMKEKQRKENSNQGKVRAGKGRAGGTPAGRERGMECSCHQL